MTEFVAKVFIKPTELHGRSRSTSKRENTAHHSAESNSITDLKLWLLNAKSCAITEPKEPSLNAKGEQCGNPAVQLQCWISRIV